MASKEERINQSTCENDDSGVNDDEYFPSACNSLSNASDTDESIFSSTSSKRNDASNDHQAVDDNPKFNPGKIENIKYFQTIVSDEFLFIFQWIETRTILTKKTTCRRSAADFFTSAIRCSICKYEFNTIDELNTHKDRDKHHELMLSMTELHEKMKNCFVNDKQNG